ncbi:hypothetical protein F5X99DRAFT_428251 [Biscogniauxia marginata]|nr:hypothetical protein F5X99DRAFT_428251 [Biscogniauxia marginata]
MVQEQYDMYPKKGIFKDGLICLNPPSYIDRESPAWRAALKRIELELFAKFKLAWFKECPGVGSKRLRLFLEMIAAVYHDQELTGPPPGPEKLSQAEAHERLEYQFGSLDGTGRWGRGTRFLEEFLGNILAVDYGIEPIPLSLEAQKAKSDFDRACQSIADFVNCSHISSPDFMQLWFMFFNSENVKGIWGQRRRILPNPDIILILYRYCQHLEPTPDNQSHTEYTGILPELIDDIPEHGSGRLERKLALDINVFIPALVSDEERKVRMLNAAMDVAASYGLELPPPPYAEHIAYLDIKWPLRLLKTLVNGIFDYCFRLDKTPHLGVLPRRPTH